MAYHPLSHASRAADKIIIRRGTDVVIRREEEKLDPHIAFAAWEEDGRLVPTDAFRHLVLASEHPFRLWSSTMTFRILENVAPARGTQFLRALPNERLPQRLNHIVSFLALALAEPDSDYLTAPVLLFSLTPSIILPIQVGEDGVRRIHAGSPASSDYPIGSQLACLVQNAPQVLTP